MEAPFGLRRNGHGTATAMSKCPDTGKGPVIIVGGQLVIGNIQNADIAGFPAIGNKIFSMKI